mgnify:CR=1 FL=1
MPHVITSPCIGTKDQACTEVCPVECIDPDPDVVETQEQLLSKLERLREQGIAADLSDLLRTLAVLALALLVVLVVVLIGIVVVILGLVVRIVVLRILVALVRIVLVGLLLPRVTRSVFAVPVAAVVCLIVLTLARSILPVLGATTSLVGTTPRTMTVVLASAVSTGVVIALAALDTTINVVREVLTEHPAS